MSVFYNISSVFSRDVLLFFTKIGTGIVVARLLGPESLGIWVALCIIPGYCETFVRVKTDRAAIFFLGQKKESEQTILATINIISLIMCLIILVTVFFLIDDISRFIFSNKSFDGTEYIFGMLLIVPLQFYYLNYNYFHLGLNNIRIYNRMVLISALVNSFFIIFFLYAYSAGIWSLIYASFISNLLSLSYGFYKVERKNWTKAKYNFHFFSKILKYGFNFYLISLLSELKEQGSKTITILFLKSNQIAFFGQGLNICKIVDRFSSSINSILYTQISSSDEKNAVNISALSFRITLILVVIISVVLYLTIENLVVLLYGYEYLETATVVKITIPAYSFYSVSNTLNSYFNGTGRNHLIPRIQILPLLILLISSYYLTLNFGLKGTCYGVAIGYFLYGFVLCHKFLSCSKNKVGFLVPNRSDLLVIKQKLKIIKNKIW